MDELGTATHTAGRSGAVPGPPAKRAGSGPANRQLPQAVLNEVPSLSQQLRRVPTIGEGRCSVAAVLLACGLIHDEHTNTRGRQAIDAARRRLGRSMEEWWTEQDWIRCVPVHMRGFHTSAVSTADGSDAPSQSSYKAYSHLLTEGKPTEWLDYGVFYLAAAEHGVRIFVVRASDGKGYCASIGDDTGRHIVLYFRGDHYECVE